MDKFLSAPTVYPSIDSIMSDVNFKTFNEFEVDRCYLPKMIELKFLGELKRGCHFVFLTDAETIETKFSQFEELTQNFKNQVKRGRVTVLNLIEEFAHKKIKEIKLG